MVGVEQWAEIRRLYFVKRLSIKEIVRRTGHGRNTIRRALRSSEAPRYRRPPRPSKLDPFRDEMHRLLREDPRLPGQAGAGAARGAGLRGRQDDPRRLPARGAAVVSAAAAHVPAHLYRPGALCQFDLWEPSREIPVGRGPDAPRLRRRRAACPTRAPAPARWSSPRRRPTCCTGSRGACGSWAGCRRRWSGTARARCTPAAAGRPSAFAALLRRARVGWRFLEPRDPQSKGVVERLQGYVETSFEPGRRSPTSSTSRSSSTAGSTSAPTSASTARCAAGPSTGWSRSAR